jgi:hypothetical protein
VRSIDAATTAQRWSRDRDDGEWGGATAKEGERPRSPAAVARLQSARYFPQNWTSSVAPLAVLVAPDDVLPVADVLPADVLDVVPVELPKRV